MFNYNKYNLRTTIGKREKCPKYFDIATSAIMMVHSIPRDSILLTGKIHTNDSSSGGQSSWFWTRSSPSPHSGLDQVLVYFCLQKPVGLCIHGSRLTAVVIDQSTSLHDQISNLQYEVELGGITLLICWGGLEFMDVNCLLK